MKYKRLFSLLLAVCLLPFIGCAEPPAPQEEADMLTAAFLKVGKADAIVVRTNDKTLVLDTGEDDDGAEIVSFLVAQGIKKVDVLLITHFDKDHVGGADTLVNALPVDRVLLPAYEGTSADYLSFMDALAAKSIEPERLTEPLTFAFGTAQALVEPPASYEIPANSNKEMDNDFSLILTLTHGDQRLVFAGDIEKRRIRQWLESEPPACDFLKMPHHGAFNKALDELLAQLSPQYAVICSSEKNPAEDKTLALLQERGVQFFETKDGNVTLSCDGKTLSLRQN